MANKNTQKVYEVSFHLLPTLDEGEVSGMVNDIRKIITGEGEVISEDAPVHQGLAYTIRHTVRQSDGSYNNYNEAYFGSIKFKASQEFAKKLHQDIRNNERVLRFLIVGTVEEDTRIGDVLPGTEEEENATDKKTAKKNTSEEERESNKEKGGATQKENSDKK